MFSQKKNNLVKISLFIVTLIFSILIFVYRTDLAKVSHYGYLGIFLATMLSSATVFLPLPGTLLILAGGSAFNPLMLALVSAVGETFGEFVGYTLGRTGKHLIMKEDKRYKKAQLIIHKYGIAAVFVLSSIPNPFFDFIGVAAGAFKIPVTTFFISCVSGKFIKNSVLANLGNMF